MSDPENHLSLPAKDGLWYNRTMVISGKKQECTDKTVLVAAMALAVGVACAMPIPEFALHLGTNALVRASEMRSTNTVTHGVETTVVWKGHPVCGADFTAVGTVRREPGGVLSYGFFWTNCVCAAFVERVEYPLLTLPTGPKTRLVFPAATGQCATMHLPGHATDHTVLKDWQFSPHAFHFLAVLDETGRGPSHYLDQRGAREWATKIGLRAAGSDKATLMSTFVMPVSRATTESYALPFRTGYCRLAKPTWFAAAALYRDYLRTEPWYRAAKARDLGRLADVGLWIWNRGLIEDVITPVEELRRRTGVPVALDWYWWHHNPYDTDYPYFWPPREGVDKFKAAVARLNAQGIYAQAYVNGQMWDMDGQAGDWETCGAPAIRMKRDGTFRATPYCVFNRHRLTSLCSESPAFQDEVRKVVRNLRACGLPSQYLDCIGNGAYGECWNPSHRHSLGGGNHAVRGWRRFVGDVKADNPGLQLSTEEPSEAYLDVCDSFICIAAAFERSSGEGRVRFPSLPVTSALYHGCGAFFGGYTMLDGVPPWDSRWPADLRWKRELDWPRLFPDQFAAEFARSIAWGLQPMVHNCRRENLDDPRLKDDVDFMIRGARFYHANRDLLFLAEMCDPGEMQVAEREVRFMNRSIYTKDGEYKVALNALPAVMHSVWQGKDGAEAILVNWTRESQPWRLETSDGAAAGTISARSFARVVLANGGQKGGE